MITQIFMLKDPPMIAYKAAIKSNLLKQAETVPFRKALSPATEGSSVEGCTPQGLQALITFPLSHPSLLFIKEA